MTNKKAEFIAKISLFVGAVFGIGSLLIALSQLPWYSAIGVGILDALVAFLFTAMFFCIEVPK